MFDSLNTESIRAILLAVEFSKEFACDEVRPEHLFLALVKDAGLAGRAIRNLTAQNKVKAIILAMFDNQNELTSSEPHFSTDIRKVLDDYELEKPTQPALAMDGGSEILLRALLRSENSVSGILTRLNVDKTVVLNELQRLEQIKMLAELRYLSYLQKNIG